MITSRRTAWLVALLPMLLAVAFIVLAGEAERRALPTDPLPAGLDSTEGTELREELPAEQRSSAVLLWTVNPGDPGSSGSSGSFDDAAVAELGRVAADLGALERGPDGPVTVSEDRSAAIAVVPVAESDAEEIAVVVGDLRRDLADSAPEGVRTQVTGPAAVSADLAAVFDGANTRLLAVTAAVVAVLLILTYRSPVLWLVPLVVVGVADRFAAVSATQVMGPLGVAWDASTIGILSVLVFGAGTDYALLLISRYRDELRAHESRFAAMAVSLRRTAEAILASAVTVVLGLLTLLLSLVPTTRGLGLACAIGIAVAAAFSLVVLPALLVLFGRWVFWPRVPHAGEPELAESDSFWGRVGTRVAAHPARFVLGSVALLAVMAVGVFRIDLGLDQADQFLDEPEAVAAAERIGESFPAGLTDPTLVVTRADPGEVLAAVEATDGVQRAGLVTEAGGIAEIEAVLGAEPGSAAARATVANLRGALAPFEDTHVTGTEARAVDETAGASRDRRVILPLILVVVLAALLVLLRAVLAPLLLVATVVATYVAGLGVSWWVFTGPLAFDALDSSVPLLAFLFLVALGVDYNIFLVTRAGQEAREHGPRRGMLRALTATGGVITSAGILLAAVFLVLGVLPLVVLAQLGTVICIGVLLDTLLVRTVLVPALALRLGDWFWWPRRLP